MSEYTKGPWEATTNVWGGQIVMASEYICKVDGIDSSRETKEANAHLISAAPDMYEALKDFCLDCGDHDLCGTCNIGKALAKAEGK